MTILNIRNRSVQVDIEAELSEYPFDNARWGADKLIASSPFRTDTHASFFVNLEGEYAGTWADSGAINEEYSRGNFVKLISLLNDISYEEASEYLIEKYGVLHELKSDGEPIRLRAPSLRPKTTKERLLSADTITQAISPYLLSRGITEDVQRLYGVGYGDTRAGYTAIPWYTAQGRLANVKYRSTSDKRFFYEKGATPVKRLVYGIDLAEETSVLVEGEIDAMSWRVAGYSAVAIGGAHLSREQAEIIKRSKIKRLYLGGDNDEQGARLNRQVERLLLGYIELYRIDYGEHKDANEALVDGGLEKLTTIMRHGKRLQIITLNI